MTQEDAATDAPESAVHVEKPSKTATSSTHGSATKRALRNKKPKEPLRRYALPSWFVAKNADLATANLDESRLHIMTSKEQYEYEERKSATGDSEPLNRWWDRTQHFYVLEEPIYHELRAACKGALRLAGSRYSDDPATTKTHLDLQCPEEFSMVFLQLTARRLAADLGARVVTIDAQDIARLCREAELDNEVFESRDSASTIGYLGYDIYQSKYPDSETRQRIRTQDIERAGREARDADGDAAEEQKSDDTKTISFFTADLSSLADVYKPGRSGGGLFENKGKGNTVRRRFEDRWYTVAESLTTRLSPVSRMLVEEKTATSTPSTEQPLFIIVEDYADLAMNPNGGRFLKLLHEAVTLQRKLGKRIAILGLTAPTPFSTAGSSQMKVPILRPRLSNQTDDYSRSITVTPYVGKLSEVHLAASLGTPEDEHDRVANINWRHVQDMLRMQAYDRGSHDTPDLPFRELNFPPDSFRSHVWSFDEVHRHVTTAIGLAAPDEPVSIENIHEAIRIIKESDARRSLFNDHWRFDPDGSKAQARASQSDNTKSLRNSCNEYEKKLLPGVVDSRNIRTTFDHVHVPIETKDAIQELTSLSLIRPDAFTYGVLKSDRIPGLLLYGPPGTGKTLLAKAVAKDSSCSVLEVSGAEINNKWVGEGEKNIKAIFTLAKKLSPCIIFIDEADSMLASRSHERNRTAHHELINQFLKEWDGMTDSSAFIMVATNRPFDLDDAVLRRLPRRLLVDLPTEEDRAQIMGIHLREEKLADDVDLKALAAKTPLYSGSDLKNVCVAAALACVREETRSLRSPSKTESSEPTGAAESAEASKSTGESSKPSAGTSLLLRKEKRPPRVLQSRHFDKALLEISASVNEDMGTLKAIRKFDEKYGDRKGRKKKGVSLGFSPKIGEATTAEEEWRVRG